jgi:hypothetical protein
VLDVAWNVLDGALAPARTARPPDLDQRAPSALVVRSEGRRYVLGFTSATDNVGLGPVWLRARRSSSREPMAVQQLLPHAGGYVASLPGVGVLRYELHPPHRHWHLDDFVRYELRSLDGESLVRDRKSGFCLVDRWGRAERPGLPTPPPRFLGDCASRQPGALRVEQGTSVGYTDGDPAFFLGHDVELTRLPPGQSLLVQTANPERRLRELSYANNAASLLLRLTWPAAPREKPRVDVLRRCTSSARCLAPGGS